MPFDHCLMTNSGISANGIKKVVPKGIHVLKLLDTFDT